MQAPTWDQFAWAVFFYKAMTSGDDAYRTTIQKPILNELRTDPVNVAPQQIQSQVIHEFLNAWGCRIPNKTTQSAEAMQTALQGLLPYLKALEELEIETVNFDQNVVVNGNQSTVNQAIRQCYTILEEVGNRFAATATSKLLHILQPGLFVVWDNPIHDHYHVAGDGQGYLAYLQEMNAMSKKVCRSFRDATLNPPSDTKNPAVYLSKQLEYDYPKTLAKYLDEYNWVTITKGQKEKVELPPPWHP